jgi:hypothetical protein
LLHVGLCSTYGVKLMSLCETGRSVTLDPKTNIVVPDDRYGLHAIDVLDPDMVLSLSSYLLRLFYMVFRFETVMFPLKFVLYYRKFYFI